MCPARRIYESELSRFFDQLKIFQDKKLKLNYINILARQIQQPIPNLRHEISRFFDRLSTRTIFTSHFFHLCLLNFNNVF